MQIVHGQEYLDDFILQTEKTRDIACSRGSIRDRNGNVLAYDELAYSVKIEDVYENSSNKNRELNATIYKLIKMIEKNGNHIITDFNIVLDEHGNYVYNVSGNRLLRFLADVYGHPTIDKLKEEERTATPRRYSAIWARDSDLENMRRRETARVNSWWERDTLPKSF